MVDEKNVIFVTTTLCTKWLRYHNALIKKFFPNTPHLVVDGRGNWPYPWFYWIEAIKKTNYKYFIMVDEDFFLTSREEMLKLLEKVENESIDLIVPPDGYTHYRFHNPVAINTYLMVGLIEKVKSIDLRDIKFGYDGLNWVNNRNIKFQESYKEGWEYDFPKVSYCTYDDFEPYYTFMWEMKRLGAKFKYLYPRFDDRFDSSNPRITENSEDIGIHMWYLRAWSDTTIKPFKFTNLERYNLVEKYLIEILNN
jgi:hypothetical protein